MPEVYRESRYTRERERDTSPSDDESYKRTTVRRYKVTPERVERVEREVDVVEEDRRSRYAPIRRSSREDVVEIDRHLDRLYIPERPRSAFDPSPRSATYVERQVVERERERDREPRDERYTRVDRVEYRGDTPRSAVVERERERVVERDEYPTERSRTVIEREVVERDRDDDYHRGHDRDRGGRVVYESTKEVERLDRNDVASPRDWDRRSYWDDERDTEVRIEKRVDAHGNEVRVERRVEERRDDGDGERWRKETEYYQPAPGPIVIKREPKIIVQEPPATVVMLPAQDRDLAVARRGSRDGEYYYHRESREVGPYRGERREEEVAVARYEDDDRHRHHHHRHHHHRHRREGYDDAEESDDGYYVKRTVIRRERGESSSPHRKRHIAEGALAGAGISAILASRRDANGEFKEHRGRKVLAGAALGAISTEVVRRAHSAYEERFGDPEDRERSRSRSRPPHSRLKTGLGIAAVALAAAGAAKYYQSSKIEKEELNRGRALHRDSDDDRSPSRKRSKSRAASVAKVGLGTAAVAGLVQHYRHKSKSRDGKSRSRSRLRTGAEILAAGLAGAGAKKLYDRHKDKKAAEHEREVEREREMTDDEYYNQDAHDYNRRSGSLTRSGPTYPAGDPSAADPELGMVEYGAHPLYADPAHPVAHGDDRRGGGGGGGAAAGYESAAEDANRRRRRRSRRGDRARGGDDDDYYSADSEAETDRDKKAGKKRSRSRLRDLAAGAAAAGAAAIGIKKYNDRKKEKGKEREERDSERDLGRDRERERDRGLERDRRRYDDDTDDGYDPRYDNHRASSPPRASGGFYNPAGAAAAGPSGPAASPAAANGFTHHPNVATTNLNQQYTPYPPDVAGEHPPQQYPPPPTNVAADPRQQPYTSPYPPDHVAGPSQQYTPYRPPGEAYNAPPPPGPPPNSAATTGGAHPPPINPNDPEHVSEASRVGRSTPQPHAAARSLGGSDKKDGITPSSTRAPPPPHPHPKPPTSSETGPDTPRTPSKSVTFIPLSPKSSATLRRHREEQATKSDNDDAISDTSDYESRDRGKGLDDSGGDGNAGRRRRNSDPSSDRPLLSPGRRSRDKGHRTDDDDEEEEEAVEMLPDRFDAQGRPLDGGAGLRPSQIHSRRGDFAYRGSRGGGVSDGLDVRGQWGVAGTDAAAVERIVQNVTGVLEGRGSLLGLIGGILSGSLLEGKEEPEGGGGGSHGGSREGQGRIADRERSRDGSGRDAEEEDRRRRRRERDSGGAGDERGESSRGSSSSRRPRGRERDDSDDYDDAGDDRYDDERKRRRRRRTDEVSSWDRGLPRAGTW